MKTSLDFNMIGSEIMNKITSVSEGIASIII